MVVTLPLLLYVLTLNKGLFISLFLIGGAISILGLISRKKIGLNAGLLLIGIGYLVGNVGLGWDEIGLRNLIRGLGPFFLLFFTWIMANNNILSKRIRENDPSDRLDTHMEHFEGSSLKYSLSTTLTALTITLLGMFILKYSYLGIRLGDLTSALVTLGFTLSIFLIIYMIAQLFPSWILKGEETKEET